MAASLDQLLREAGQLRRTTEAVGALAARAHFPDFARETVDLPVVSSVALEEAVPATGRGAFERSNGLVIDRPGGAPDRLPSMVVTSAVSNDMRGSALWGLDVFVDPLRREVLRSAFAADGPRATPPVSGLGRAGAGLTLYLPLARRAGMPLPDVVAVSLRLSGLGAHLAADLPTGARVAIREQGRTIASNTHRLQGGRSVAYSFAGRHWQLVVATVPPPASDLWLVSLGGGWAIAVAVALLIWSVAARLARGARERASMAQRVSSLFEHSPLALMVADSVHRITEVNPAMVELLGWTAEELTGRPVLDLVDAEAHQAVLEVGASMVTGDAATLAGDVRMRHRDGRWVWTQMVATPQRDGTGRFTGSVLQAQDIEQRRTDHAELEELADTDPLTRVLNRRAFERRLEGHHVASPGIGAVYLVDLDRFKQVNDTWGHAVGDRVLEQAAEALRGCLRQTDALARLGGDEFAVLISEGSSSLEFERLAQRLAHALSAIDIEVDGRSVCSRASVGWAAFADHPSARPGEVVRAADRAMYRSKQRLAVS